MKVSIGPSTIGGWLAAISALVTGVVLDIDQNRELFTGPGSLLLKISAGILVATHAGRQYQAAHLPGSAQVGEVLDELPVALQGETPLDQPPQPDAVQLEGSQLERSGA